MSLPIDDIRPDFERALDASSRLVVTAETGAGKSTCVPVWLAERFDGPILVVEPRRVACHALADFLAGQRGEAVGGFFGSRVRFSDRSSRETRVLFCTPGVALRILADAERTPAAIVVDEFHERSWQMDLVVAAAASLPRLKNVPLILTSATIDAEAAAGTLGAETLHAKGRTFPVEVLYAGDSIEPHTRDIGPRTANTIARALQDHPGDVLVFLPGMREIRAVESALGRGPEEVLVVHGSQPPEAMRRVFQSSKRRRVYLSTNVAETSITLPGVRVVIDSGLAKTRLHRAGRAVLATTAISDASMQQRAGRAGRVAAGVCIRMWSDRFQPEPYQRPEIERIELDDLMLQAAEFGLVGEAFASALWVTQPPEFAVERAVQRLAGLEAVDAQGMTQRGRDLARLPVSAEEAALLVGAPPSIAATLCDLVALLQSRGSLLRDLRDLPPGSRDAVEAAREELLRGVADEVTTNLVLLRRGDARTHHLSGRRLDDAKAISRQLRELIGAKGRSTDGVATDGPATERLARYILERLPTAGFVKRPRADKKQGRSAPWANGSIEVQLYPFEPADPETTPHKAIAAVILETEWLSTARGVTGIGRMVLPAAPKDLAAAGLGETKITDIHLAKNSRGRPKITARREVQLASVSLASDDTELRGPDLHRAVATFVFGNRLFKGAGDAIRDALHSWSVLAHWKGDPLTDDRPAPESPPDDEEAWLATRLQTLGVESTADLSLLEPSDLLPDLEALTGIAAWAAEPVLKAFPRSWKYDGGLYSCTVLPAQRTVQLQPMDAKARKRKEPPATALPRFFGFRVTYQQGSRRLTLR
ncbi:MAG: helicase-related protein [Planctomycetota bacterium]